MADTGQYDSKLDDLDAAPASLEVRVVVGSLMLAAALVGLDNNIVNTALPRISNDLHGVSHMSWIVTSFMLGQCSVMPIYGKLSDTFGRKPLLVFALILFLLGSALCGFSRSLIEMASFRALQGVGASGITILSPTIVADLVAPRQRGRILGLFMGAFAASSLAGPLVGGAITTWMGWRWIFYINLPLGLVVLGLMTFFSDRSLKSSKSAIDIVGATLLVMVAGCFIMTLNLFDSSTRQRPGTIYVLLCILALLIALFFVQEHMSEEPILAPSLFRQWKFLKCIFTSALVAFPFFGAVVFMPLYLQVVVGLSPLASGLAMTPQVIGLVISSRTGGWLLSRKTDHTTLIGYGVAGVAAGLVLIGCFMTLHGNIFYLEASLLVLGLGGGLVRPNLIIAAQTAVSKFETGAATAAILFVHTLSGTAGVSCAQTVMNMRLRAFFVQHNPKIAMHALVVSNIDKMPDINVSQGRLLGDAYAAAISNIFLVSGLIAGLGLYFALSLGNTKAVAISDCSQK